MSPNGHTLENSMQMQQHNYLKFQVLDIRTRTAKTGRDSDWFDQTKKENTKSNQCQNQLKQYILGENEQANTIKHHPQIQQPKRNASRIIITEKSASKAWGMRWRRDGDAPRQWRRQERKRRRACRRSRPATEWSHWSRPTSCRAEKRPLPASGLPVQSSPFSSPSKEAEVQTSALVKVKGEETSPEAGGQ